MSLQFSPSVNIIRDSERKLRYVVTPNASRIARRISEDFKQGFHAFNLIGSYGTGKSAFLWAFAQTLKEKEQYFNLNLPKGDTRVIYVVGDYAPITEVFAHRLGLRKRKPDYQDILDALYQEYEGVGLSEGLLVVLVDELGKLFEYAVKNDPEKEIYFIQQLAEFANASDRNILLVTALHQSFESYGQELPETQKKEWTKVKGRLRELPFNEPVEQLLLLTKERLSTKFAKARNKVNAPAFQALNKHYGLLPIESNSFEDAVADLYPVDVFAAYVLTLALQQYGQNERSLFTFLESADEFGISTWKPEVSPYYSLANVYDYLYYNFFSFLTSKYNPHFNRWLSLRTALERCDSTINSNAAEAARLIKTVGLLNIFGSKGSQINDDFLLRYSSLCLGFANAERLIESLVNKQIVRFSRYDQSYRLWQGTDLNIDEALIKAAESINPVVDVAASLNKHFQFPFVSAKSVSYKTGTPRNFEFIISEEPMTRVPIGEIDGFINLVFNEGIDDESIKQHSAEQEEAIVYGYFTSSKQIRALLLEIEKTQKVIGENQDDHVAVKELRSIKDHQKSLLNHYVLGSLYSDEVLWFFRGEEQKVTHLRQFNRLLSEVCESVYVSTPVYRNELANRHKIQGNISAARKNFFEALVNDWRKPDLGFNPRQFPPEKTVYSSLLRHTGIHDEPIAKDQSDVTYELGAPIDRSFYPLWGHCDSFLESSKAGRRNVAELVDELSSRPFKMKQGLIDFWVPTYLFIRRGDFALFENDIFVPYLNETKLYEITRNPSTFEIKAFEITGIRLKLYNKYREFMQLERKAGFTNADFIESIRPFLTFYKGLPDYCKRTQRLSEEALSLRSAIANAKDPERVFFEEFPLALKLTIDELTDSEEVLGEFARTLDDAVTEIKLAYASLLDRIESFIQDEIAGAGVDFEAYKQQFKTRFESLKPHQLAAKQKMFLQRLLSPIDDRDSWIASIGQVLLQKPLEQIIDDEEDVLKAKLLTMVKGLDNLREIHSVSSTASAVKVEITTPENGTRSVVIEIPKSKAKDLKALAGKIKALLKAQGSLAPAVLSKLLSEELEDEES